MKQKKASVSAVINSRTIIPRWKSPESGAEIYVADKFRLKSRQTHGQSWVKKLDSSFGREQTRSSAVELFETATMYGLTDGLPSEVRKLAISGYDKRAIAPSTSARHSNAIGIGDSHAIDKVNVHEDQSRLEIRRLRHLLSLDPNRPFCWSELGRHFLVVAEPKKAIRCMQAALQLTQKNRYLYRSAARLYVHVKDPERALRLLRSEPEISVDPWLLAAEIATTSMAGRTSRYIGAARRLLSSNDFSDGELSELAAAVGTVDLTHGGLKDAKALFNKSLVAPTENSLAQAQWAVEQDSKIVIPPAAWRTPESYEAQALAFRQKKDWKKALTACAGWLADEPFSSRPAIMASYIGFQPEHQAVAEQFATAGLRCHSDNIVLLNNRAVARVGLGKINEAFADVQAALSLSEARDYAHLMATLGLIAFRSGIPEFGRKCYAQSIAWLQYSGDRDSVVWGILHFMREEIRVDRLAIPQVIAMTEKLSKTALVKRDPELAGMAELVLREARHGLKESGAATEAPLPSDSSADQFGRFGALFNVPAKAKQLTPRLGAVAQLL